MLEDTERLLRGCTSGNIAGQWKKVDSALRRAFEDQLPHVVMSLRAYGAAVHGAGRVERMRGRAEACLREGGGDLEKLMPELDLMTIRYTSLIISHKC